MTARGKVYFVGAGPGAPDLLTVRALNLLRGADTVVYDSLVTDEVMALVPDQVEKIAVRSKPRDKGLEAAEIGNIAARKALDGNTVVRLKSGDPLVFSRIGEEIDCLTGMEVEFEIVPGISSAFFSAAVSRTMLTDRRYASSLAIVTGHEARGKTRPRVDWEMLARAVDVLIVLMGASNLTDYCRQLRNAGMDGRCAVTLVGNASRGDQAITSITLDEACGGGAKIPSDLSTVLISKNVLLEPALEEADALMESA